MNMIFIEHMIFYVELDIYLKCAQLMTQFPYLQIFIKPEEIEFSKFNKRIYL